MAIETVEKSPVFRTNAVIIFIENSQIKVDCLVC